MCQCQISQILRHFIFQHIFLEIFQNFYQLCKYIHTHIFTYIFTYIHIQMLPVKKWERYINNELLECIQRPQPYNFCAISCILEILLYLGIQSIGYQDILEKTELKKKKVESGSIGNDIICQALNMYQIKSQIYNHLTWNEIESFIKNKQPIIYHRPGHYCLVVGYCEEPYIHNNGDRVKYNAEKTVRWLIIADHRVKNATTKERGLLEMIQWNDIQKVLKSNNRCGFIVVDGK